jgi:hypothetical protein
MKKINNFLFTCIFLLFLIPNLVKANTIKTSTILAFQNAINNAAAGDVIILANGIYQNVTLNVNKNNITVKAETPGGVFLNGGDDININGNYITFSGFQFTSGDIGSNYLIEVFGSHNILSHLNISGYYAKKYIEIKAGTQYNEITYCNLEKKPADAIAGCTIQISTSATVPGYHKISYCSFQDYYGLGGDNGNEPVRIGLGAEYLNKSRSIVEHCYFNNTGWGDSESVSVKCQENVIRYCTFTNQQNAMLCFRNGDNNVAYSNFFINAGGIRVKEANNIFCYNNYFENSGVGSSADAVTYVYVAPLAPPTTASPRSLNLGNINFIHNTFYNCGDIDLGGIGATNNTWANNIFQKSSGTIFINDNKGTAWAGNIYQGKVGITIPSGMTNKDPILALNSDGFLGLSANSPKDNADVNYPTILDIPVLDDDPNLLYDCGGQARPATVTLKDVGCDEFTTGATTNHPLKLSEVGPSYLVVLSNTDFELNDNNTFIYPNPTKNNFQIKLPTNYNKGTIKIYQINGQLIQKREIYSDTLDNENNSFFDVSEYKNGVYFVQLQTDTISKTYKLIIKN